MDANRRSLSKSLGIGPLSWLCWKFMTFKSLQMSTGISPEKLLYERSRGVKYGTSCVMFQGMGPENLLFDRSRENKPVQYSRPRGNWPSRPKLLRFNAWTLLSLGLQHSTPVNRHMKPSLVVLSNFHDDSNAPLLSSTDYFKVLRHMMSRSEPKHDEELLVFKSSSQRRNLVLSAVPNMV